MAVNGKESPWEKVKEFFTQKPADFKYEKEGGDADVPESQRHGHPLQEANEMAREEGKEIPYPEVEAENPAAGLSEAPVTGESTIN